MSDKEYVLSYRPSAVARHCGQEWAILLTVGDRLGRYGKSETRAWYEAARVLEVMYGRKKGEPMQSRREFLAALPAVAALPILVPEVPATKRPLRLKDCGKITLVDCCNLYGMEGTGRLMLPAMRCWVNGPPNDPKAIVEPVQGRPGVYRCPVSIRGPIVEPDPLYAGRNWQRFEIVNGVIPGLPQHCIEYTCDGKR